MEVIVGHLGRLEFMTSGGTAFNRIGELVRLARVILHRACNVDQPTDIPSNLGDFTYSSPTGGSCPPLYSPGWNAF